MTVVTRTAVLALALCSAGDRLLGAQAPSPELTAANKRCAAVLKTRIPEIQNGSCAGLATYLADSISSRVRTSDPAWRPTPKDLQSTRAGGATAAGTPAQAEAVPGVRPTAVAAASLAAAGTDSGSKTITAISINPATLFGGADNAAAAKWSRFGDLTILVPLTAGAPSVAGLSYLGMRVRMNITGISAGDALLTEMTAVFGQVVQHTAELADAANKALLVLKTEDDVAKCVAAIETADLGTAPAACGGTLRVELPSKLFDQLRVAMEKVRDRADARYFGLDLRLDTGDPTLGAMAGNDVNSFAIGLAYGQRFLRPDPASTMSGVRLHLAAQHIEPKSDPKKVQWSAEGGAGFEISRMLQTDQYMQLSGGLEFRYSGRGGDADSAVAPNYMAFRAGLTIPIAGGTSLAVGFNAPMTGSVSPSLTVNFNWGLALSALAGSPASR